MTLLFQRSRRLWRGGASVCFSALPSTRRMTAVRLALWPQPCRGLNRNKITERLEAARAVMEHMTEVTSEIEAAVGGARAESVPWIRRRAGRDSHERGRRFPRRRCRDTCPKVGREPGGPRPRCRSSGHQHQHATCTTRGCGGRGSCQARRRQLAPTTKVRETGHELDFLSDVCEGLRTLASATRSQTVEFDLSEELRDAAGHQLETSSCARWTLPGQALHGHNRSQPLAARRKEHPCERGRSDPRGRPSRRLSEGRRELGGLAERLPRHRY